MQIIQEINTRLYRGEAIEDIFLSLEAVYGIKSSNNPKYPELYCLNYDQVKSSFYKHDNMVKECRSLVIGIDDNTLTNTKEVFVVSCSFDRFFNYGEGEIDYDINQLVAYEKVDGSLVSVFNYGGEWLYRTKSMIMPDKEMTINGGDVSWKELIESLLSSFVFKDPNLTYIFEVVSPYNRVVTRYKEPKAYLLAVRHWDGSYCKKENINLNSNTLLPKEFTFSSFKECCEASKELRNLEEGFVLYDKTTGIPKVKVKSPAYVAAHRLKGENVLSSKRIMDLILINEVDEYLTLFPEDNEVIKPYKEAFDTLFTCMVVCWEEHRDIEDQKEFALSIKDAPYNGIMFTMKKNKGLSIREAFDRLTNNAKYRLIEEFLDNA